MVYLDYSATTPVDEEILQHYINITRNYIGNVNSLHECGKKAKEIYENSILDICMCLNCIPSEVIITSGASESNSLAILGTITKDKSKKHIITSRLEHKSILELMDFLKKKDVIVDYVKLLPNGQIDYDDLERLINDNTLLVSICGVNSETGYKQDLKKINKIIKSKNKNTLFHSDLTQALGKTKFDLKDVDLASFSSHKIYAPKGCGMLYKKRNVEINKLVYGTNLLYRYRGGTPALPLVAAFSLGIKKAIENLDNNIDKTNELNQFLRHMLSKYNVVINSNDISIPQIFNFSNLKILGVDFIEKMSNYGIYLSTTSACNSSNGYSKMLFEITSNMNIASTSIRVSISHLTTKEDIEKFIECFDKIYNNIRKEEENV